MTDAGGPPVNVLRTSFTSMVDFVNYENLEDSVRRARSSETVEWMVVEAVWPFEGSAVSRRLIKARFVP